MSAAAPTAPAAVLRALRQLDAHPSVREVELVSTDGRETVARLVVTTELPAAWKAAGVSPFGVRREEPVTLAFPALFPLAAPLITLRADFPRHHPHIQPGPPEGPVQPCLVAGSPREVVQARGLLGLVEQLVEWLDRASGLSLNDPAHGWEPVRRDDIDDVAVFDASRARGMADAKGGAAYAFSVYLHHDKGAGLFRIHTDLDPVPMRPDLTKLLTRTDHGEFTTGTGIVITAWPGRTGGGPFVTDRYLPEDVTNLAGLLDRAALYGCREWLQPKLSHVANVLQIRPAAHRLPVLIVLIARRPYPLVGSESPLEICPYLIEAEAGDDLLSASTPVRLVGHRDRVNTALLRSASADTAGVETQPWTLVGCGSVGSKVALHAARGGRAPAIAVDRDSLDAHNYARHSALPSGDLDALFFQGKAETVREQAALLSQSVRPHRRDVLAMLVSEKGRTELAPAGTAFILDTTGSIVTREALAHADWPGRPRAAEACLLGAGAVGYLALEGPASNPTISDIAAEAYNDMRGRPLLAAKVFGAEAEAIAIGQGCSAVTFAMPDTRLSAWAATLAGPVTAWAASGLPGQGLLRLGEADANGSIAWRSIEVPPFDEVAEAGGVRVRIHPRVHAAIEADVARHPGVETGGVLVGRFSSVGETFQVVDVLPAPEDSVRTATEFVLGTRGLKRAVTEVSRLTNGALQAVGTWHSHLEPHGPSATDAVAGALLALRQYVPALLLIHTPAGYAALIAETRATAAVKSA